MKEIVVDPQRYESNCYKNTSLSILTISLALNIYTVFCSYFHENVTHVLHEKGHIFNLKNARLNEYVSPIACPISIVGASTN